MCWLNLVLHRKEKNWLGNFDVIHPGYMYTFETAKCHCDYLIIFLHDNPRLTKHDKYEPVVPLYERYKVLIGIRYIDEVVTYQTEDDLYNLIKFYKPDIRILGDDYIGRSFTGDDLPPKVIYTTRSHGWSTTKIKNLITEQTIKQNPKIIEELK